MLYGAKVTGPPLHAILLTNCGIVLGTSREGASCQILRTVLGAIDIGLLRALLIQQTKYKLEDMDVSLIYCHCPKWAIRKSSPKILNLIQGQFVKSGLYL